LFSDWAFASNIPRCNMRTKRLRFSEPSVTPGTFVHQHEHEASGLVTMDHGAMASDATFMAEQTVAFRTWQARPYHNRVDFTFKLCRSDKASQ
jgi:hypothetical protein